MKLLIEYPHLKIIKKIARRKKWQVHLVGGALRDYLIGKKMNDFDFTVSRNALKLAELFADEIRGKFILLDEERECARVVKKIKGELLTYDFAGYRAKTFEGDLAHRDFTINTLSVDMNGLDDEADLEGVIYDYKNGCRDIRAKRIERTSAKAFKEDPLRMMRAFSLKANLGFKIELKTLNQIRKDKDLIRGVSYERIREELFKVLESAKSAQILKSMDQVGLLEKIIPQIHVMYNCRQGGYHHLDVWPHSLEVVNQLDKIISQLDDPELVSYINKIVGGGHTRATVMKLAALLHDIGKPDTRKKEGERLSFHGHEHVGRKIVTAVARMLKLSTHERHILEDMVELHLRPGYLSNFKKPSERMIYRYLRDTKEEAVSILLMSLADQRATRGPLTSDQDQEHHESICMSLTDRFFKLKKETPYKPLINGGDLIKHLKLNSSPIIGKILSEVKEQHVLGKINTKKQAIDLGRAIVKGKQ